MSTDATGFANADQALIHRFIARPDASLAMDSNPLAIALRCELLRFDAARRQLELGFAPEPLFIQGSGVLQGGIVGAMLDFAMAFAVLAQVPAGVGCATVSLNTSFLRAAPQGRYRAVGEVERCGRRLAFARAWLVREGDEDAVASASSTLALG